MRIFRVNKRYRLLLIAGFLSLLGTTLFDLVGVLYASTFPAPEKAIAIVGIITSLPYILGFIVGYASDRVANHYQRMMKIRLIQAAVFILFGFVTLLYPTWWVFSVIMLINLFSDLIGSYSGYLGLTVYREVVAEDDFPEALAFRQGISDLIIIVGKNMGVLLIGLLSNNYFLFAMVNALFFVFSYGVMKYNEKYYSVETSAIVEPSPTEQSLTLIMKTFFSETWQNLKQLNHMPQIKYLIYIYALMNFISSGMQTILYVVLVNDTQLLFVTFAFTIVVLETAEMMTYFLGSLFQLPLYKKMSIEANLIFETLLTVLIVINLLWIKNSYLMVILAGLLSYLTAISNPKSDTIVLFSVEKEKQNAIFSIFSTVVTATVPLSSMFAFFLVSSLEQQQVVTVFLVISIVAFLFACLLKYLTQSNKK